MKGAQKKHVENKSSDYRQIENFFDACGSRATSDGAVFGKHEDRQLAFFPMRNVVVESIEKVTKRLARGGCLQ